MSVYASTVTNDHYRNSIVAYPAITTPDFTNPGQIIGFCGTSCTIGATLGFHWKGH